MICSIHKVGSNSMHNFLNKLQQFYQLEQQQQEESKDYKEPIMTREQHKTIFQSSGDGLFLLSFLIEQKFFTPLKQTSPLI